MLSDHSAKIMRMFDLGSKVAGFQLAGVGEQGRVWRLETDRGTFAVKELLKRQNEVDASADVDFQEAVLRAGTVSIPRPLRSRSGRVLAHVGRHQVRAYEWVNLLPANYSADLALIGATLAAIHRVRHEPARPLDGWYTDPVGAQRWQRLHRDAVAAGAPFADRFAAEIPVLLELEALMERPRRLQNCHRDLWADNILPMPGGGVCVIDWENCGLEDPAHEIPMALIDFSAGDPQRSRALFAAYVECGGPARLRGRGVFTMVIAQFGHFWESAVDGYTTPGATEDVRAHSITRIEELLRTSLRVHHIDDTLDAIAGLG